MRYAACTSPDCPCQTGPVMSTPTPKPAPDLDAIFDRTTELVLAWWDAEQWADNCPKSERDRCGTKRDEAKDEVMQYLSHVWGGAL